MRGGLVDDMAEVVLAYRLDAASSDSVKLWLGNLHEALEKQPARELFDKFSRDTTVTPHYLSIYADEFFPVCRCLPDI